MKNPASSVKRPGFSKVIPLINTVKALSFPRKEVLFDQAGILTYGSQRISRLPGFINPVAFWEPLPTYSGQTVRDSHPVPILTPLRGTWTDYSVNHI